MFHHPPKSHIDPQKVKKVKKVKKKNPYYENVKSIQKSVNLSPTNGSLVFVPDLYQITGTSGTYMKCTRFPGTY